MAPNAQPREVDAAFRSLHHKYLIRSQWSTKPGERDMANNALALLQDARRKLTGSHDSTKVKPFHAATAAASSNIPRASLGGKPTRRRQSGAATTPARSPTQARHSATNPNQRRKTATKSSRTNVEDVVAFVISVAIFLLALSILACVWSHTS